MDERERGGNGREGETQESSERGHTHYLNARHSVRRSTQPPRLSMHELPFSPFLVPCPLCLSYSHFLRAIPSLSLAHFFLSVFRSLSVAYSECCPFRRLVKWTIFDSSVLGLDEERRRLDSSREEDVFKTKRDKTLRACEERYVSLMRVVK